MSVANITLIQFQEKMKYRVTMNALALEKEQGNALSNVQEMTV